MTRSKILPKDAIFDEIQTPVGQLKIIVSAQGVHANCWEHEAIPPISHNAHHPWILKTGKQPTEYFSGSRQLLDLPLILMGTNFQLKVWRVLEKITYGQDIF